jgi:hypothetical protein
LLLELYEQAMRSGVAPSADDALGELALSAGVIHWRYRWQPITMHRALLAGASLSRVAEALGVEPAEVCRRWEHWAEVQTALIIAGRPAVDPDEFAVLRDRLRTEVTP